MKILISVLSYEKGHWADLENAIRSTWGLNVNDGIEIIYYYGDSNKTFMESDKLYTDTEEGVLNVGYKTIKMFNYCYNNFSFDYIFRTNSSSYVNTKELLNFIKNKPLENFYSGIIGSHRGVNFASGSGYFISRDLVQAVISSQKEWDHSFIDDVSLGKLIHEKNINLSIDKNIIGTCNIVKVCKILNIKLIYLSTAYVYPGFKGSYKETDALLPYNNYAWSKLGGECAVQMYSNSLILRISMTEKPFIHKYAFKDLITNFIFHDEVVKIFPKLINKKGIINLGGQTKSVYAFARKYVLQEMDVS